MALAANRRFLLSLLSATALTVISAPAFAACPAASGGTITVNNAQVDCEVTGGENLVVTNAGSIASDNNDSAVLVDGQFPTLGSIGNITNNGSINGNSYGLHIVGATAGDIVNNNLIQGQTAIRIESSNAFGDDYAAVVNSVNNSGTLSSTNGNTAFYLDQGTITGALTNSGTITGFRGIDLYNATIGGGIVNTATGNINDDQGDFGYGIYSNGSTINGGISNSGVIDGAEGGIYLPYTDVNGGITNTATGTISSTNGYGIYADDGAIHGGIVNAGAINSYSGIYIGGNGIISLDGGITNSGTITGNQGIIVATGATVAGGVVNSGTINTTNESMFISGGTVDTLSNSGTINTDGYGIRLTDSAIVSGNLMNSGTINSTNRGILVDGSAVNGNFVNSGAINADARGIYVRNSTIGGSFTNSGTVMSDNNYGLSVSNSMLGDIVNTATGVIRNVNEDTALYIYNGSSVGNITNNGLIDGGEGGLYIEGATVNGVVTNNGTIRGGTDYALYTANSGALTINNTGLIDGNVYLDNTTLNLNGMAGRATGTVQDNANSTVNVNGTFTAENEFAVNAFNIANGGRLNAGTHNYTVGTTFNNAGTLAVGQADVASITGNYDQTAGGTFRTTVASAIDHGTLAVSGVATFAPNTNIFVDVTNGNGLAVGNTVAGVVTAGTLDATTFTVGDNSALFNFAAVINGNNVDLETTRGNSFVQSTDENGNSGASSVAPVLDNIVATNPNGNFTNEIAAFSSLQTSAQLSDAATQVQADTATNTGLAILNNMNTTGRIVQARQEGNQGLSSGDGFFTNGNGWLKPFGSWAQDDGNNGSQGYDADTYGVIAGADKLVNEDLRLGVALSYANSNIDGNGAANSQKIDVDSYQAMVYGSQALDHQLDLNFQVGAGVLKNDESRNISIGGFGANADADYTGYNAQAGVGVGRTFGVAQGTTFTPSARADYAWVRNDSFNEHGAGALNLSVGSQTAQELIPAIDGKVQHNFNRDFSITGNLGVGYDLLADDDAVTSAFQGGGASFSTSSTKPSPWVGRGGIGATLNNVHGVELTARFDTEVRGDYDSQTVSLKLRAPF